MNLIKEDILKLSFIEKLNILSIDIVIGSVAGGIFVVKLLNIQPGFAWRIILPFSVWIVYSLDHLIDGIIYKNSSLTLRNLFYYHYRKEVFKLIIFV